VLVTWDDSRKAARALADALPVLRTRHRSDERPAGSDVAAYLERHNVRASFSSMPRMAGVGTGAELLNKECDVHADLLVMGAYAHSRGFERVLGGVTRPMLESMTVRVLMSHCFVLRSRWTPPCSYRAGAQNFSRLCPGTASRPALPRRSPSNSTSTRLE